jgi:hypothetical protein
MVTAFVGPQASSFMMQPCADIIEWIKFWVVRKNDFTSAKSTWFFHDWTPVAKKSFKISSSGATAFKNIASEFFLR